MSEQESGRSGWEYADKAASGVGAAVNGIGVVLTKIYGLLLIVAGIWLLVAVPGKSWWLALILIAYGAYLVFPGSKHVVW